MGLSRSAATVLAYAMKEFGWPLERALRHVRRCRPGVLPNAGFMRQLDFYQGILHARWAGPRGTRPRGGRGSHGHAPSGWGGRGYYVHSPNDRVRRGSHGHAPN